MKFNWKNVVGILAMLCAAACGSSPETDPDSTGSHSDNFEFKFNDRELSNLGQIERWTCTMQDANKKRSYSSTNADRAKAAATAREACQDRSGFVCPGRPSCESNLTGPL